ncbi:hypothetical protein [Sporosarcina cyprini]|uniref:hypothetical protein n=1 Tax=Sporosarcina cyprini TaxID=2910523 RepID=UPI001EDDC98D|nr:hypothetical protein [Sporosarcina cyprini]MCG3089303.1 hypothetical protein [Sporosarcina cyprini]
MKKELLGGLLLLLLLVGCSTKATLTPEMEVEQHLQNYLKALEDYDVTTLVELSDDIRFPDKKIQLKEYLDIEPDISKTEIIEITAISPTEFEGTISYEDVNGEKETKFPIIKQKSKWKVIVGQTN